MKNILRLFIFLLVFSLGNVKAERFYEDNYVSDIYATYIKDDYTKSQHMRFIRRYGDFLPVYCLTPDQFLYEDEVYTARINNPENYLGITKEKYKKISEIAYFGYNYKNHTDSKWYAITQMMLWKEIDPLASIFYTDTFKGNKITRFTEEEKEIEKLIENYHILPNINNLNLQYGKQYEISDSNNILNEYKIESNELDVKIEDNKLKINANKKGNYKVKLIRKDGDHSHITIAYTANKGQDVLIRGMIEKPTKEITINITGANLEIKKIDSETLNSNSRGEASIVGANYNLYDEQNDLIDTLVIDKNGVANVKNIKYGNYTLKEVKAPVGYNLDNTTYNLKIDSENENIILKENIIKAKLIINKYLKDDETLIKEANITFSIYDNSNNLVKKITTNDNGQANIELIYGKYKIIQENTTLGYKKVKDFYIEINSNENKIINLENERVLVNLKINKKDIDSKENIINSSTSFKIKDLINDTYLQNNDSEIFETDDKGIIDIKIKGGKYRLEEIKSPNGYILCDNIEFIIDENTEDIYELNVYNKKQYGRLQIIKKGKLINNNLILLKNVQFNIYAYQEIKTDDNIIHYKKDELVDTIITDINGIAISKKLIIGKYYIEEVSTLNNFILDKNKYIIDFNNNSNLGIITKEISILNKEKEIIIEDNSEKTNEKLQEVQKKPEVLNKEVKKEEIDKEKQLVEESQEEKNYEKKLEKVKNELLELNNNNIEIKETEIKENIVKTKYPKTSNRDKYIYIIISYLLFIAFMLIITSIKDESKNRNSINNN